MDDTKLGATSRGLAEEVVLCNGECWITFDILCGDLQNYQSPIENWSENLRPFAIFDRLLGQSANGIKTTSVGPTRKLTILESDCPRKTNWLAG